MKIDDGGATDGVGGVVSISDLNEERRDCKLLRRAAHEGWDVPEADRPAIISRMVAIAKRETVTVATANGPAESESVADANAIQAARVLVAMTAQNQADRHHAERLALDEKGQAQDLYKWAAGLSDEQLIEAARQYGYVDRLPPRLRMIAERKGKEGPP